ncbi:MAG: SagB family peptide dehydrogenase [Alphaproteobacteria bacterium]
MHNLKEENSWHISDNLIAGLREGVDVSTGDTIKLSYKKRSLSLGKRSWLKETCANDLSTSEITESEAYAQAAQLGGRESSDIVSNIFKQCRQHKILKYSMRSEEEGVSYSYIPFRWVESSILLEEKQAITLSKFAYCRRDSDNNMRLECPKTDYGYVIMEGWQWSAILSALFGETSIERIYKMEIKGVEKEDILCFIQLLYTLKIIVCISDEGQNEEDNARTFDQWEFHDLLYHANSRSGRHDNGLGGTYRFKGKFEPLDHRKPIPEGKCIELCTEGAREPLLSDDPHALSSVISSRKSLRSDLVKPITKEQLSSFLYWSASVNPHAKDRMCNRHYPSAGAVYETEIYIIVNKSNGLERGLYYYDPYSHNLHKMKDYDEECRIAIQRSYAASGRKSFPDVLIIMAARFQKISYKYEAIAYSLILKNVGALYNNMYLVATDLGLSPCGLGSGDSDQFARMTNLDYMIEGAVGEFRLSGCEVN